MKSLFIFSLLAALNTWAMGSKKIDTIKAVTPFEIKQYLGDWYEIGSNPQFFSKGCVCTKATYLAKDNGQISVFNQCRQNTADGALKTAKAKGRFATDDPNLGHLEVNFTPLPFLWADYVVSELGAKYDYAVVTNFQGTALWILSRVPEMPESQVQSILEKAKSQGIDTKPFALTLQKGCW